MPNYKLICPTPPTRLLGTTQSKAGVRFPTALSMILSEKSPLDLEADSDQTTFDVMPRAVVVRPCGQAAANGLVGSQRGLRIAVHCREKRGYQMAGSRK